MIKNNNNNNNDDDDDKYISYIDSYKDFPKKGVIFWDFNPLLNNPKKFKQAINEIKKSFNKEDITKIAAIESKGFTIGSALAYEMNLPLVLIRKPGLIPGKIIAEEFTKEYGNGEYQIKKGSINKEDKILIIYDIMAGSGATNAAINLIEKSNALVSGCAYIIELEYLNGRKDLKDYNLFSLVKISDKISK